MSRVVAAAVVAVLGIVGLLLGRIPFAVLVIALAAVALVDLSLVLARAGTRTVLPVAAVPGIALPILVAVRAGTDPVAAWELIPLFFAMAFLLGVVLLLAFGRRGGVAASLGATMVAGLIVGMGAAGLLLLHALPDGFRWVLVFGLLTVTADASGPLAQHIRTRGISGDADLTVDDPVRVAPLEGVVPALIAVTVVAFIAFVAIGPPLTVLSIAVLALLAVVTAIGGAYLQRTLATEGGLDVRNPAPRLGSGLSVGVLDALLLGAPAAYVLARAVVL